MANLVNKEQISRDWEDRGFSCDLWTDPPGQVWQDYVHAVDEVIILLDGMIEIDMDDKTLRPEPGEEIFIPANAIHTLRNTGEVAAHWLYGYQKYQI